MLDTLAHTRFSWGHLTTGVIAVMVALWLLRYAVGRLHRRRIHIILGALGASIALHLTSIAIGVLTHEPAPHALGAGAVLLLAFGLTGLLGLVVFDLGFRRARLEVPTILRDIAQAVVFFIVLLVVLRQSGVNLLSLVTTSAVLTAVIGLALQNTIANMFAGLSLQLDRTLNVGDWIQLSTWVGRITHIKWRSTFIVTRDGNNVILPNSELLRQEVLNFSKPSSVHRTTVSVGIAYRHPPREVARVLVEALRGMPEILPEPAPDCIPTEFGDSAITYALRYWTNDVENDLITAGEVRVRLWYATQRAGLEIPFPMRVVQTLPAPHANGSDAAAERDRQERRAALARVDLFAPLDRDERELLVAGLKAHSYASGEVILHQGDVGDSLYLIHRGAVTVSITSGPGEREVARLEAGDFFGEMSLLTGAARSATCRAATDVECWVVDHDALRPILAAKPEMAEEMSRLLAARQAQLAGHQADAPAAPADAPLAPDQPMLARIRSFFSLG